ncbi:MULTISPECIES: DedA family protein [Deefgea]|uniref:DedA family protein n=1 Tax=Deefgea chitinilytica TaxID=570276 RepID=A0ABS2C9S9_9NEIS|nr:MULTISPECIES: DedA family protein [Deefgea]MBM5570902.1 DedA family protein [Deefgea chitinilytica]MBM9888131.1 DedA family protein [Deefgea sp. CFH1-16]
MEELLHNALNHSAELALLLLFAIVLAESTALIGLIIPGTVLMITMGTLIGSGKMDFWLACGVGFVAALIGDVLSYWLGFRYRRKLHRLQLIRQHRRLLLQARHVLRHHGPIGIFVGRFLGPTRPVLPMVAGMLSMSPQRFMPACILACLLWSPTYFLPGILAGAAYGLGETHATHFPTLLFISAILSIAAIWMISHSLKTNWNSRLLTVGTPITSLASAAAVYLLISHPHADNYGERLWKVIA